MKHVKKENTENSLCDLCGDFSFCRVVDRPGRVNQSVRTDCGICNIKKEVLISKPFSFLVEILFSGIRQQADGFHNFLCINFAAEQFPDTGLTVE